MKSFKQYLIERGLATLATVGALGATGAGMYSAAVQPESEPEPEITKTPFSTPTQQFVTSQPSPDEGKQPTVLSNDQENAGQRNLQIQQHIVDHVKSTEGFRNKAYKDTGGVWTIGYGSTHHYDENGNITRPVKEGDVIDEKTAERNIVHHIKTQVAPKLEQHHPFLFDMKQNKEHPPELIARFMTMAYNAGTDPFTNPKRTSIAEPLYKAQKEKDPEKRKEHIITALKGCYDFHKDNGKPIRGLLNRRHEKVISVLNAMKNTGYITPEQHEMHSNHARQIHQNYMKKYGWK